MSREMNEALWTKLLEAQSAQEAVEILRANGEECTPEEAPLIWQEIERFKADLKQAGEEETVFMQEVSMEEMESAAGGAGRRDGDFRPYPQDIYGGKGFPNCAATVESGSWCNSNDACVVWFVRYQGMEECPKAWK